MAAPPQLTAQERRAALHKAAEARQIRAAFKAEVKAGKRSWTDALISDQEAIQRMRLKELLASLPGFGEIRAQSVMERAGISPSRKVQGVGNNQRAVLLRILKGRT
jgi:hypothetical protein